jgi:hypothetical protein
MRGKVRHYVQEITKIPHDVLSGHQRRAFPTGLLYTLHRASPQRDALLKRTSWIPWCRLRRRQKTE